MSSPPENREQELHKLLFPGMSVLKEGSPNQQHLKTCSTVRFSGPPQIYTSDTWGGAPKSCRGTSVPTSSPRLPPSLILEGRGRKRAAYDSTHSKLDLILKPMGIKQSQ